MRMVEMGWQLYTSEVDDRGIDYLIRTNLGKCVEAQVKTVRLKKNAYVFFRKDHISPEQLKKSYAICLVVMREGEEPDIFFIPGRVWLAPNDIFVSHDYEGRKSAPEYGIAISQKNLLKLSEYILRPESLDLFTLK
jgi:hypothetical protein